MNVDAERGVANAIAPGDHVDIATSATDEAGATTTSYLLQNVKVLAVGTATAAASEQRRPRTARRTTTPVAQSGLLTFEVTREDALRVIAANNGQGQMYLVLLPPKLGSQ